MDRHVAHSTNLNRTKMNMIIGLRLQKHKISYELILKYKQNATQFVKK